MNVQPYLFFDGNCEEALAFYTKALGAEVTMMLRFKDNPETENRPPVADDKIMHARLRIGDTVIFAGDGMCRGTTHFDGFGLSLTVANEAEADRMYNALLAGGKSMMPRGEKKVLPRGIMDLPPASSALYMRSASASLATACTTRCSLVANP